MHISARRTAFNGAISLALSFPSAQPASDFTEALEAANNLGWNETACPPLGAKFNECQAEELTATVLGILHLDLRPAWRRAITSYGAGHLTAAALAEKAGVFENLRLLLCVGRNFRCYGEGLSRGQRVKAQVDLLCSYLETALAVHPDGPWTCSDFMMYPFEAVRDAISRLAVPAEPPAWQRWVARPREYSWLDGARGCASVVQFREASRFLMWPSEGLNAEHEAPVGLTDGAFAHFGNLRFASILRMLSAFGANFSGRVIDLGAGALSRDEWEMCEAEQYVWDDPATCMVKFGWAGVLFESDPQRANEIVERFRDRSDVVVGGMQTPSSMTEMSHAMYSEGADDGSPIPVDLLKLDSDNGDCDFLEAALARPGGLDPLLLHVEMNMFHAVPPPIAVRHRFDPDVQYPEKDDIEAQRRHLVSHRGCSLAAVAALAPGYEFLQMEGENAIFVRRDLVPAFPSLAALQPQQMLKERWWLFYWCQPWRPLVQPVFTDIEFDMRILADERLSAEQRAALLLHYLENRKIPEDKYEVSVIPP